MPTFSADALTQFAKSLLLTAGATDAESRIVAESLVQSNLRGHDSHGVMRIPFYIERLQSGIIRSGVELTILKETASVLCCDGNWGFGQALSREMMGKLIRKAKETGIGSGSLYQAAHIGRLGEYAEMAAKHQLASIVIANTHGASKRVAPVGGKRPRLGTNPICMGMPGGKDGPFILDFGTSATAEGKVRVKRIAGEQVPPGWLLDSSGQPTTDPHTLYGDPPGTILPMGGNQAYKGFGLSFLIEMFCSGLSGAPCVSDNPTAPMGFNAAFFIIIDPELFAGFNHLKREVLDLETYVRSVPKIDEEAEITLPGDPEKKMVLNRLKNGIVFDKGNWQALRELAHELKVEVPLPMT